MAADRPSKLDFIPAGDMGGEYEEASAVESFVDSEIGLDVLQSFGKKSAGRRRTKPPLFFEYTRDLEVDDALVMQQAPARKVGETGGTAPLQRIRTIHHQIARMLADGQKIVEISAILGVTVQRIQQLKNDPTFCELRQHYEDTEAQARIDLKHRFYLLGTTGMEELQERLLAEPDSFGNGHLMELVKLTVGGEAPKSSTAPAVGNGLAGDALEQMKRNADASSRSKITYRNPESANGETETD